MPLPARCLAPGARRRRSVAAPAPAARSGTPKAGRSRGAKRLPGVGRLRGARSGGTLLLLSMAYSSPPYTPLPSPPFNITTRECNCGQRLGSRLWETLAAELYQNGSAGKKWAKGGRISEEFC